MASFLTLLTVIKYTLLVTAGPGTEGGDQAKLEVLEESCYQGSRSNCVSPASSQGGVYSVSSKHTTFPQTYLFFAIKKLLRYPVALAGRKKHLSESTNLWSEMAWTDLFSFF